MTTVSKAVSSANTDAKVTTALTPQVCFALVMQSAVQTRNAALHFVYSVTAFMLNVVHLQDSDSKDYMNKANAQTYIKDQLVKTAGVKGGMLDHYVRTGAALYDSLIGLGGKPTSIGAPIVLAMVKAKNDEAALSSIVGMIDALVTDKIANGKAPSFRDLSKALGFKSFAEKANTGSTLDTTAKVSDRITNTMTAIANASKEHKIKGVSQEKVNQTVAHTVAQALPDPLAGARECLNRVAQMDNIEPKMVQAIVDLAIAVVKKLEASAKARALAAKNAPKVKAPIDAVIAGSKLRKGHVMHAGRGGK